MPNGFDKFMGGLGDAIEQVPELYDDALKPATQQSGKFLERIPRAINAALAPLDCWIREREHKVKQIEVLLEQKLNNVPPENIIAPEPYIAVPAIQAISYSMDSDELRELYANLLAKSMNKDTKGNVHPAFVEIIKQMSPNDAAYFTLLTSLEYRIIADIIGFERDDNFYTFIRKNANFFSNDFKDEEINLSIINLIRLGLIDIPINMLEVDSIEKRNAEVKKFHEKYNLENYPQYKRIDITEKSIIITELGALFDKVCVNSDI